MDRFNPFEGAPFPLQSGSGPSMTAVDVPPQVDPQQVDPAASPVLPAVPWSLPLGRRGVRHSCSGNRVLGDRVFKELPYPAFDREGGKSRLWTWSFKYIPIYSDVGYNLINIYNCRLIQL